MTRPQIQILSTLLMSLDFLLKPMVIKAIKRKLNSFAFLDFHARYNLKNKLERTVTEFKETKY